MANPERVRNQFNNFLGNNRFGVESASQTPSYGGGSGSGGDTMETRVSLLEHKVSNIETILERIESKIDIMDAKFEDKFAKMDAKFEDKFAKMDAKFEDKFAKMDAKLEDKFAKTDAKLEDKFAKTDAKYDAKVDKIYEKFDKQTYYILGIYAMLASMFAMYLFKSDHAQAPSAQVVPQQFYTQPAQPQVIYMVAPPSQPSPVTPP